ncbi:MAG TPA: mechanosensitive ion channel family protein [Roseiflexaceae bacterium]|nr:mechanosensitive ion channel family protein [Roseiflexaceae bacterium]
MDDLLRLMSPANLLPPLLYALAAGAGLLLVFRLLRPYHTLRGLAFPYALGAVTLALAVFLSANLGAAGMPMDPRLQHALLAVLLFAWGFVGFGLAENLLFERMMKRGGMSVPRLVRDIARAVALVVAVLATLQFVLEIPLSSIVISSTILSAVIGLALQDLLKNVIAGVALQIERPFEVGHWIRVGQDTGKVVEMSWRATRVITVDGNYIIYPNATLSQADLVNFSLPQPLQAMHVQIAVGYTHPPNAVKRVLVEAMLSLPDVSPEPRPSVKVWAYGDYGVTYDLKFWLHSYDRHPEKRDTVMTAAWYALHRAGIELPLPIRQVYLHQVDPLAEAEQRQQRVARVAADLRRVDLLDALDDTEVRALAERVQVRLYAAGETLVRQGGPGDTFCILRSGRVRVDVDDAPGDGAAPLTVNHLGPGDFFGELGLLTGAPRAATVVAEEDSEVLVVAREDFAPLLHANPELAERLGELLALRLRMNEALLANRKLPDAPPEELSRRSLVGRIRQLFGLGGRD